MAARTDDFMKLTFVSGRTRAMVGKDHVAFTDTGGRFAWSVATYVDFHEFNRNGVVDRFIVQGLSMDDAIRLVLKLENEARKEVSCHTPTASAALSLDTTGSTNPTS